MSLFQDTALYCPARPPHVASPNIASVSGAGDWYVLCDLTESTSGFDHSAKVREQLTECVVRELLTEPRLESVD